MGVRSLEQGEGDVPRFAPPSSADQALGLQYCRLGLLSLMRLQLAFERGDRSRVLEAIDELQALDAEVEHLVEAFPAAPHDERLVSVARQLKSEKMAANFEKLALASGISGPGLSPRAVPAARVTDIGQSQDADDGEAVWPPPVTPARRLVREYGVRAAVMLGILAASALLLTQL